MGMWDDWKDNITKAFRYVPMADTAMDVYDFLSGKTPDQIADEKTRAMTENDELSQWEDMSDIPPWEQADRMADELLNPDYQALIDASSNPALTEAILQDKDPSEMGFKNFTKLIQKTPPLTYSSLMEYKLAI